MMKNLIVHQFGVGDVDDPDLYANMEVGNWLTTEKGKWIQEHRAEEIRLRHSYDLSMLGHRFVVTTKLKDEDATFFLLKYSK